MSEERKIATIKGSQNPHKTEIIIGGESLGGIESIEVEYKPDSIPVAVIRLIDFDINHKGRGNE